MAKAWQLEFRPGKPRVEIPIEAAIEVGPALFFSLLIITVSFLPILTLEAQEGRLFKPLAFTKTFAEIMQRIAVPTIGGMVSSTLLTLIVIPALYSLIKGWEVASPKLQRLSRMPGGGPAPRALNRT
jgi:Cu(I)/Ag(I) efflux system membrane protein CusA/SilA